jgi:hypothetical protein
MAKFFSLILLVAVLASVQSLGFSLFGVKPSLALVGVIAVSFFAGGILEIFLFSALAALILKFAPALGTELSAFFAVSLLAGILGKYFPWRRAINNLAAVFLSVLLFYFLIGIELIASPFFWKELFLNLVFGGAIFYFLSLCGKMEK